MIKVNPSSSTFNIDNSGWFSCWTYANNAKSGIVPSHSLLVKNTGSEDAYLTSDTGVGARFTISPGDIVNLHVPAGDDVYATSASSSGTTLEIIASVH